MDASYPRKYYFATNHDILTPGEIPLKAGNVIAAYDTDALYYDVPNGDSGEIVRRKASAIEFVGKTLPQDRHEPNMVFVVETGTTTDESGNIIKTYSGYRWNDSTDTFDEIFNNLRDFHVLSTTDNSAKMYLTGSTSAATGVGTLIKNSSIFVEDGKINGYLNGTAKSAETATSATEAETAGKATNDRLNHDITGYIRKISSNYPSGDEDIDTKLTITFGDNNTTTVWAKNTQYSRFNTTTAGLVDGTNIHGSSYDSGLVLTGDGWLPGSAISIGTAEKAIKDNASTPQTIHTTYIKNGTFSTSTRKITFTKGDGTTFDTDAIPDTKYSTYTENTDGLVPKPTSTGLNKFLKGTGWAELPVFTNNGSVTQSGIVPASGATAAKYFKGDGTWGGAFTGASSSADGAIGLVPAPLMADANKFLCGNGTWVDDTLNTAGANNNDVDKLYIVGAASQTTSTQGIQTFSNNKVFIQNNKLYSNNAEVADISSAQVLSNKSFAIGADNYTLGTACSYPAADNIYPESIDTFTGDGSTTDFPLLGEVISITSVLINDVTVSTSDYSLVSANGYSDESTYSVGDCVTYDEALYRCSTAISTPEEWNSSHWTLISNDPKASNIIRFNTAPANEAAIEVSYTIYVSVSVPTTDAVVGYVNNQISDLANIVANKLDSRNIAPYYDETVTYSPGEFCIYQDTTDEYAKIYKCTEATTGDFDNRKWTAKTIIQIITNT